MRVTLGEETREFQHPNYPEVRPIVTIPDRARIAEMSQRNIKASDDGNAVEAVEASEAVLVEILRGVPGLELSTPDGQPVANPTMKDFAKALAHRNFNFRREDYAIAWNDNGVLKDPDSGLVLRDGQHHIWQHPETGRIAEYVFEEGEAQEPVKRVRTWNFADHIVASVLRNAPDDDAGKGSPTLSADR